MDWNVATKGLLSHSARFVLQGDDLMLFSIKEERKGWKYSYGNKWSHALCNAVLLAVLWEPQDLRHHPLHHLSGKTNCFDSLPLAHSFVVFLLAMEGRTISDLELPVFACAPLLPLFLACLFPVAWMFLSFTASHWTNSRPRGNMWNGVCFTNSCWDSGWSRAKLHLENLTAVNKK